MTRRNFVLSIETQRAMDACRGSWGIYIQADEVLHERGARVLRDTVAECDGDPRVEGLLVKYLHFYGGFDTIAMSRRWYRREVRCVRLKADIRSYEGAQGFRVGPGRRKIRARVTGAEMFHYGWARPARAIKKKLETSKTIYPWIREQLDRELQRGHLEWIPLLRPFSGEHPAAARAWVAERAHDPERVIGPRRLKLEHLRFYVSDWIERVTRARVFEYKNYEVV
jgi:hypothetical protein